MDLKNQSPYHILSAYRKEDAVFDCAETISGLSGLLILAGGITFDSTPVSIGGASLLGLMMTSEGLDCMKAYFEARLDYLKNNKFTKIKE